MEFIQKFCSNIVKGVVNLTEKQSLCLEWLEIASETCFTNGFRKMTMAENLWDWMVDLVTGKAFSGMSSDVQQNHENFNIKPFNMTSEDCSILLRTIYSNFLNVHFGDDSFGNHTASSSHVYNSLGLIDFLLFVNIFLLMSLMVVCCFIASCRKIGTRRNFNLLAIEATKPAVEDETSAFDSDEITPMANRIRLPTHQDDDENLDEENLDDLTMPELDSDLDDESSMMNDATDDVLQKITDTFHGVLGELDDYFKRAGKSPETTNVEEIKSKNIEAGGTQSIEAVGDTSGIVLSRPSNVPSNWPGSLSRIPLNYSTPIKPASNQTTKDFIGINKENVKGKIGPRSPRLCQSIESLAKEAPSKSLIPVRVRKQSSGSGSVDKEDSQT